MKKPKLGTGKRFQQLSSKLARKGADDPDALAAWIGRKKYGKKKFQKLARGGKNPFFGNALPFQLGDGGRWFDDSRPMGKMMTKKKG
jgi:hypothetical protein